MFVCLTKSRCDFTGQIHVHDYSCKTMNSMNNEQNNESQHKILNPGMSLLIEQFDLLFKNTQNTDCEVVG